MVLKNKTDLQYLNRDNVVAVTTNGYDATIHTVNSQACNISFGYEGCGYDCEKLAILFLYYFGVAETIDTNPEVWLMGLANYILKETSVEITDVIDIWKNPFSGNLFCEIFGNEIEVVDDDEAVTTLVNHLKEAIKG